MNITHTDEKLTRRARELFLASAAGLDAGTLARLRQARQKAVEAAETPRSAWAGWRIPAGATALLTVAVVVSALWWNGLSTPAAPEPFNSASNEDLPIVLTSDNLDMYADLDFYQWLETQDKAKAATPPPDQTDDSDDSDDVGGG